MTDSKLDEGGRRSQSIQDVAQNVKKCTSTVATFFAAVGPLCFGYSMGYSSSALVDLKKSDLDSNLHLTIEQGSWFAVSYFPYFSCGNCTYISLNTHASFIQDVTNRSKSIIGKLID